MRNCDEFFNAFFMHETDKCRLLLQKSCPEIVFYRFFKLMNIVFMRQLKFIFKILNTKFGTEVEYQLFKNNNENEHTNVVFSF